MCSGGGGAYGDRREYIVREDFAIVVEQLVMAKKDAQ